MTTPTWDQARAGVTSTDFFAQQKTKYERFFQTHVKTGVTDGLLSNVSIDDAVKTQSAGTAAFMKGFAEKMGVKELTFTQDGTWVIPPSMREAFPDYKRYLAENVSGAPMAGTATLTILQNNPIPVFKDGEQQGGFESGDFHNALVIIDRRTGKVLELHPTFLEDSNRPAFRPGIVALNGKTPEELARLNKTIKDPKTPVDGTAMLAGKYVADAAYQCEYTVHIDEAFNWNNGIIGSNFNYIPVVGMEMQLTEAQLNVLLFDRALASREGGIKALHGVQNQKGYVPETRDAFYPDGTERFVIELKRKGVDQSEFINAYYDADKHLHPSKADMELKRGDTFKVLRVQEYVTVVAAEDMQVVKPYNHFGGTTGGFAGTFNCLGSMGDVLDGVIANENTGKGILQSMSGENFRINGICRTFVGMMNAANEKLTKHVTGPVSGDVDVYKINEKDAQPFTLYDYSNMPSVFAKADPNEEFRIKDATLEGLAGKAIAIVSQQQEATVAARQRAPESQLTLFPVGTTGEYAKQFHDELYGAAAIVAVKPDAALKGASINAPTRS